ncbi:MAG TPA: hypothetical protein ENN98_08480 [Desulfurivibrio alkaliphilus]|uniref:Prolipoprotein diacylglyceryl transferase n=1 Tax=Desulfurivibrio alkaliphilus TaxID=427923 RepID=A0A7C2XPX6_9BACT|nr:hypothetical protein [Desulfurivibrio alkaliphilus]
MNNMLLVIGLALVLNPLLWLYNYRIAPPGAELAILPVLAALVVAFIIGEGVGRMACLSFGCCYGKPLSRLGPRQQRLLAPFACVYAGENKKNAYADNLAGVPVVPIQLLTSLLYVNVGLLAFSLFLFGYFGAAFALAAIFSLGWRVISEQFRADYRGGGKFSAYQLVNLFNIVFCLFLLQWLPASPDAAVRLGEGAAALWHPGVLLFLQLIWILLLLYFGISRVTGVRMEFNVRWERI